MSKRNQLVRGGASSLPERRLTKSLNRTLESIQAEATAEIAEIQAAAAIEAVKEDAITAVVQRAQVQAALLLANEATLIGTQAPDRAELLRLVTTSGVVVLAGRADRFTQQLE